jgi:hypothetical protein
MTSKPNFVAPPPAGLTSSEILDRYYRFLSPKDLTGGFRFNYIDSGVSRTPDERVFNAYLKGANSGETIIEQLKDMITQEGFGLLYNTVYQKSNSEKALYLDDLQEKTQKYWIPSYNGTSIPLESRNPSENFFQQVCGGSGLPPASLSINLFRGPTLSEANKGTAQIQLFLNNMPSIFASQMVPYFDIEFQFPVTVVPYDGNQLQTSNLYSLQRPSLHRFLMGSEIDAKKFALTPADLSTSFPLPTSRNPQGGRDVRSAENHSYFVGMEMFTTPQTLTNMDTLGESRGRLNPVKPFLPPASLINASVQIMNAGADKFAHKTANVVIKIHDKARLVEFSEYLRSAEGHRGVTVWLTYGWLAPRNRGEDDIYAKFVNDNMLVREAFMIKNNSFAFDNVGQVEVKLELVSKGYVTVESSTIDIADRNNPSNIFTQIGGIIDKIQKNRHVFGSATDAGNSEIRIYQILNAASAGNLNFSIESEEFSKIIEGARAAINAKKNISQVDKKNANDLLDDLTSLYTKSQGSNRTQIAEKAIAEARSYNKTRFDLCRATNNSPDPFLPDPLKKIANYRVFSEELIKSMNDQVGFLTAEYSKSFRKAKGIQGSDREGKGPPANVDPNRTIVSFGKIFSVFCVPALLASAKAEGIDEVQINFFQLNESCGPLSLHNISEFPINIDDFESQFSDLVYRRGGDAMTVQEFVRFIAESQFLDNRAPGYGMRSFYEPYNINKPEETKSGDDSTFNSRMSAWIAKWGSFKKPNIAIKMETLSQASESRVDLLYKLQSKVGFDLGSSETAEQPKKIKRISIYDKQFSPFAKIAQVVRASDNNYKAYEGPPAVDVIEQKSKEFKGQKPEDMENLFFNSLSNSNETKSLSGNKNILKEYVGNAVPTLMIGTNGSLISNVSLASKVDGLLGTINMQGSSYRATATLAPNGLSMGQYGLPVRVVPASLTMNSLGCPIADLYQQFFIDFGTGTTIDNLYACTQLAHNFAPGKFETSWTFQYTDGYGKFYGAPSLKDLFKGLDDESAQGTPTETAPTTSPVASSGAPTGPSNTNK